MHHARDAEDTRLLDAHDHSRLLATYYPVVVERCRLRLPEDDAYEVAHRVFERVLRELARGKRYSVPFRVVVHMVTEWKLKEFFMRGRVVLLPEEWDSEGPDPFEGFEQHHDIGLMLAGLPERTREVVRLRWLDGLEIEQIAERLGMTRNAVDQALHRGRQALRETVSG